MINIRDLIKKYKMVAINGGENIKVFGKPNPREIEFIKGNKYEIIEEIKIIRKEKTEAEIARKEENKKRDIKIDWHDGEYLQAYMVYQNGELLEELGLATYISGWGYKVNAEVVEELGKEFTAEQAREYARPTIEKKEQEKEEKKIARNAKIDSAIETAKVLGHKVEIERYTVDCDGSAEECSTDILVRYIDGKGSVSEERIHTH